MGTLYFSSFGIAGCDTAYVRKDDLSHLRGKWNRINLIYLINVRVRCLLYKILIDPYKQPGYDRMEKQRFQNLELRPI